MNRLAAWDLDGTIRPGSLLSDAVQHGISEGFMDPTRFVDPTTPTYEEVDYFVAALANRSRKDFQAVTDRLSDEAPLQAYPWALEELKRQNTEGQAIILSHSPDFLVRAFAKGLGVRKASGSWFHTSRLMFSGRAVTLKKQEALSRYMRSQGIGDLSFAAGDSEHDLPLLERAERSVVVNPSIVLAKLALDRGWHIIRTEELQS